MNYRNKLYLLNKILRLRGMDGNDPGAEESRRELARDNTIVQLLHIIQEIKRAACEETTTGEEIATGEETGDTDSPSDYEDADEFGFLDRLKK